MGNKQSYDLTQAQARTDQNCLPEEVVSPQDEFCRPVSMASTSSMRKPTKQRKRQKENDKENLSIGSSSRDTASPGIEEQEYLCHAWDSNPRSPDSQLSALPLDHLYHLQTVSNFGAQFLQHEHTRESAIDVPEEPVHSVEVIKQEPLPSNSHYDQVPVEEAVLVRATELPKSKLNGASEHVIRVEVAEEKTIEAEKLRAAKQVAEEAVKHVEAKRNSQDSGNQPHSHHQEQHHSPLVIEKSPPSPVECEETPLEVLPRAEEIDKVPLEQGGSGMRTEQEEIDEATRQLDDAIQGDTEDLADQPVVLEESAVKEFATVSLALEEDISAIETKHHIVQKLHYTPSLGSHPLDAAPSQTHYTKLK